MKPKAYIAQYHFGAILKPKIDISKMDICANKLYNTIDLPLWKSFSRAL
jgi:hypothetical protein